MKLLIKLYKPDGTCEEIVATTSPAGMFYDHDTQVHYTTGSEWETVLQVDEGVSDAMKAIETCLENGGRIEISPIVE